MPPRSRNEPGVLRQRLTRLRIDAGLTGVQLADQLGEGWTNFKVSKIEHGRQARVTRDEVTAWAVATAATSDQLTELLDLLEDEQATQRRWAKVMRGGAAAIQQEIDRQTRAASVIRDVGLLLIPGLLQAPAYIEHIATEAAITNTSTDLKDTVAARIRRTEVLQDQDSGRVFEFVIAEAALRTWVCPREVMASQMYHLLGVSQLPNVTVGIIPMQKELSFTPLQPFSMLDDTAIIEGYSGDRTVGEDESSVYSEVFDRLMAEAVTGDVARAIIVDAAAALA